MTTIVYVYRSESTKGSVSIKEDANAVATGKSETPAARFMERVRLHRVPHGRYLAARRLLPLPTAELGRRSDHSGLPRKHHGNPHRDGPGTRWLDVLRALDSDARQAHRGRRGKAGNTDLLSDHCRLYQRAAHRISRWLVAYRVVSVRPRTADCAAAQRHRLVAVPRGDRAVLLRRHQHHLCLVCR